MQLGVIDFYGSVLNARQERATLVADNIANADTPNYKAVDISFAAALAAQLGSGANTGNVTSATAPLYRSDGVVGLNGNDVSLDTERVNAAANGEAIQAATVFLHQATTDMVTALRPNPSGI
ncbi:flagellar basal body rod protein FlgB [Acidocella sp.]|uniref:flagellar basal body rod protein FlgB n=1 Tax=Acidocella sp. TaxID=50710 RepID=UPI002631C349|nr:flagellar basal body rod protein FlgB [Acidocella sp.]